MILVTLEVERYNPGASLFRARTESRYLSIYFKIDERLFGLLCMLMINAMYNINIILVLCLRRVN